MLESLVPAARDSKTSEEDPVILAAIALHPALSDSDRLGARRKIRGLYGLPPTNHSTREYDEEGCVKGSRSRRLLR